MKTIGFAIMAAVAISIQGLCFGMGAGGGGIGNGLGNGNNGYGNNGYVQQDTKDTLNWPATKFEDAKSSGKPVLLLVKDENDHLHRALKDIEKMVDDAGVKGKLGEFNLIEVTHGGNAGWKDALGQLPIGDTRLVVIGWDFNKRPVTLDTLGQDKLRTNAQTLLSDIALAERLIQKNKDDAEREAKEREKEKAANAVKK